MENLLNSVLKCRYQMHDTCLSGINSPDFVTYAAYFNLTNVSEGIVFYVNNEIPQVVNPFANQIVRVFQRT